MASPEGSPRRPIHRSISPFSEMSSRPSEDRGSIRLPEDGHLRSSSRPSNDGLLRPSHESLLRPMPDGLLQPSTEADRIELVITGRGRSGTASSRKMTITYGPIEGDDTPESGRNLLQKSAHATTPVEQYQDEEERAINHQDRLWTPWSLQTWTLVALFLFFVLTIVVLEILSYISTHHSGLSTQVQSRRYLWTYGPCAIFFVVAAVWHSVKYWTQQLTPWRVMAEGPAAASHSLLLDYISPWNIVSFFRSARAGHRGVALVVLGSFLIKVVIIASTGLLSIQSTFVTQDKVPVRMLEHFAGNLDLGKISAADAWMGLSDGNETVWPKFQSIKETEGHANITALVDVFAADLQCEQARSANVTSVECADSDSSTCDVRWIFNAIAAPLSNCTFSDSTTWVSGGPLGTSGMQRFGILSNASCVENTVDSQRLVITTGYLNWDAKSNDTQQFHNATASICKPTLTVKARKVTLNGEGEFLESDNATNQSNTTLTVTAPDIAEAVWKAVNMSSPMSSTGFNSSDAFINLISLVSPELDLDEHTDLVAGIRAVYKPIAAQIARTQLMVPADNDTSATDPTMTEAEDRLLVNVIPLRILEGALAFLVLTTAALYLARPAPSTPRDTSTIAGLATVMAQSPRYITTMKGLAAASYVTIKQVASESRYHCSVTDIDLVLQGEEQTFRIEIDANDCESALEPSRAARTTSKPETWWLPIYDLTRIGVLAAIFIVLMVIELLHQQSQKKGGLFDVENSSSKGIPWPFVPAIIMIILFSWIGTVDFATRLMQPYHELKKSPVPAQRSIFINYLSQPTLVAMWNAVANIHFAVLFSAFAVLVAPLLTIVSTSLYVPTILSQQLPTKVSIASSLSSSIQNTTIRSGLPFLANTVVYGNTSWPAWTNDTCVFPSLNQSKDIATQQNLPQNPATINIRLPVLYSRLNCTRVPTTSILTSVSTDTNNASTQFISIPVAKACGGPCSTSHGNKCDSSQSYINFSLPTPQNGSLFGRVFVTGEVGKGEECPPVSVLYGKGWISEGAVDGLVGMNCFPQVLQTEANSTWSLPSWRFQSAEVDSATEKVVAKGNDAIIDLSSLLANITTGDNDFDGTFSALTGGRDAIPSADLLGESNVDRVAAAIDTLYARVMAQHLNLNTRSPPTTPQQFLNGTLIANQLRLVQDTTTTRILETLLALTFICIVLASLFGDSRKVLPNNPCSIAVMSTLIADSDIVKKQMIPSGSEWFDDAELKKRGVFSGYLFSLGVWDRTRGTAREGGVLGSVFGIDVGKAGKIE